MELKWTATVNDSKEEVKGLIDRILFARDVFNGPFWYVSNEKEILTGIEITLVQIERGGFGHDLTENTTFEISVKPCDKNKIIFLNTASQRYKVGDKDSYETTDFNRFEDMDIGFKCEVVYS